MQEADGISPGTYTHKYSIELPVSLPGSFLYQYGCDLGYKFGKIQYHLSAEICLEKPFLDQDFLYSRTKCPIYILQSLRRKPEGKVVVTANMNPGSCSYLCSKAVFEGEIHLEKDFYDINDQVKIKFRGNFERVINKIGTIQVSLVRTLILHNVREISAYIREMS